MIKEAYVSFEIAKLLKEKGFNEKCKYCYAYFDDNDIRVFELRPNKNTQNLAENRYPCVTHQMVMAWLREVYHIEISVTFGFPFIDGKQQYKYFWSIVKVYDNHLEYPMDDRGNAFYNEEIVDSYEEAVEAGLKYCLEKIIK